jgi:hypothetical protein
MPDRLHIPTVFGTVLKAPAPSTLASVSRLTADHFNGLLTHHTDPMITSPLWWFSPSFYRSSRLPIHRIASLHNVHNLHTVNSPQPVVLQWVTCRIGQPEKLAVYA